MTQEEKARAYDEALERAMVLRQEAIDKGYALDYIKDYETIFPELRESEDERIRKELIEFIQWSVDRHFMREDFHQAKRPSEWIAYLEKQKEQKPANEQFPPLEGLDAIKAKYYDDGFKNGFDEGVESVKPAKWSEEDEERLKAICTYLQDYPRLAKINDVKRFNEYCDWLKSLPLNLKKKNEDVAKLCSNEWSEEDEKIAKEIEEELWYPGDFPDYPSKEESELYDDCQRRLDWFKNKLKSLRPSWKPSAQELGALKTAVSVLTEERTFPKAAEQIQKIIDVFDGKELRKDWKPSGEQMEVLVWCKPLFCDPKSKKILESLISDLNKLM